MKLSLCFCYFFVVFTDAHRHGAGQYTGKDELYKVTAAWPLARSSPHGPTACSLGGTGSATLRCTVVCALAPPSALFLGVSGFIEADFWDLAVFLTDVSGRYCLLFAG